MEKNAESKDGGPWFQGLLGFVKKEVQRPEVYSQIISPILWALLPYGVGFLVLNFFTTLLAVGMVIYVRSFYIGL